MSARLRAQSIERHANNLNQPLEIVNARGLDDQIQNARNEPGALSRWFRDYTNSVRKAMYVFCPWQGEYFIFNIFVMICDALLSLGYLVLFYCSWWYDILSNINGDLDWNFPIKSKMCPLDDSGVKICRDLNFKIGQLFDISLFLITFMIFSLLSFFPGVNKMIAIGKIDIGNRRRRPRNWNYFTVKE